MLLDYIQTRLSEYSSIYDILIPRDHMLRRMNEEIDFSFVRAELAEKYSAEMGRIAEDPVRMFKYLMLKAMHPASDKDLVERAYTDMSYKFFLGLNPEDKVIDSSLLSKFRRQRLEDADLLELLISKSVAMALAKGIIKRKSDIIVDATHELAKSLVYSPLDYMRKMVGQILKACEPFYSEEFPKEAIPEYKKTTDVEQMKSYCIRLIGALEETGMAQIPAVGNKVNLLREGLDDLEHLSYVAKDKDAKFGSKGKGKSFYGYKAHICMTPEGIVAGAAVTSGEASDGDYLIPLVEQAKRNGLEVESAIADAAYSGKENLDALKGDVPVVAPVNPTITQGHRKAPDKGFHYNKDADTYVCPAGRLAIRKEYRKPQQKKKDAGGKVTRKYKNGRIRFLFDVDKCKECPLREGCYKKDAKSKSYNVTILSDTHKEQIEFQETPQYKEKMKVRNRIEALNGYLKNNLGMKKNISYGIESMTVQTAVSIYMSNILKIMRFNG